MNTRDDDRRPERPEAGHELEDRIRRERPYDLAEAVGREAAGALKGASPVPAARQLLLQAGELLAARLPDPEGALTRTVLARLEGDPPLLARHFGEPAAALREWLDGVLASPPVLADLVRDADTRWGRQYGEKPRFETPGQAPAADDPYTLDGVTELLRGLRRSLDPD